MEELVSKANSLKHLEESFNQSLRFSKDENTLRQSIKQLVEWIEVKKQIRLLALDAPILSITDSEYDEIRSTIQKIMLGEKLPFEAIFTGTALEQVFETDLDFEEIENLEDKLFYTWFSGYDFVKELYSVGALITGVGELPKNLLRFVDELRLCYVFQRYLAVFSLCRAILDITMRDLFTKNNLNDKASENYTKIKVSILQAEYKLPKNKKFKFPNRDPSLYQMIKMLTALGPYKRFSTILDDIREKTNPIVHGNIENNINRPLDLIQVTLSTIHDLYEIRLKSQA